MASPDQPSATYGINSGLLPEGGPKALRRSLDFTAVQSLEFDLEREETAGFIGNVQAVFVDNSLNSAALTIVVAVTQLKLVIPPQSQGVFPIFAGNSPRMVVTTTGAVIVPIQLLNIPLPFAVWGVAALSVSVAIISGSFTDKSIAGTGASQLLMAANAARKRVIIQNPSVNNDLLYINFGAAASAAGDSIEIPPSGIWDSLGGPVPTQAINAFIAAGNIVAKEM